MKLLISMAAAILAGAATSGGCDQKQEDTAMAQGRAVAAKAADLAGSAWNSTLSAAHKLSPDSGKSALESATAQLESMREKLSHGGSGASTGVTLDGVNQELHRLQTALTVENLKRELDEREKTAMQLKENGQKTVQDVRERLRQADAEYQNLLQRMHDAQATYDSASRL